MVPSASAAKSAAKNHPFVEHYKFVKQFEDENCIARQTMPAPAQLLAELYREDNGKKRDAVYPDHEQLLQDIAAAYRTVIRDLYNAGCRSIQFDDCTWGMFGDPNYQAFLKEAGVKVEDQAAEYLRLNNLALEGRPEDLTITTHVCRGTTTLPGPVVAATSHCAHPVCPRKCGCVLSGI